MTPFRAAQILLALAFGASLPTLAALLYYAITGDPTARPLGISSAALERFRTAGDELAIEVTVTTGTHFQMASSVADAENLLSRALAPYDVPFEIKNTSSAGRQVTVTFRVRETVLGPYPIERSAHGVSAALAAYRMNASINQVAEPTGRFLDP